MILQAGKEAIRLESEALMLMESQLGDSFEQAVNWMMSTEGRVVVTGIGKSGIIAQKWVATFNSTGQPALFMHAADAIHGDLGMIQPNDLVVCISKSGESPEIRYLVPILREMGNGLIAVTANEESFLADMAHMTLITPVNVEACPNNLAPTTSTTLQLVLGDAIAVALMRSRGFSSLDFAKYHPGGSLGKKLTLKVSELMGRNPHLVVEPGTNIAQVITSVSAGRLGAVAVVQNEKLVGVITDGDIRRMLENRPDFTELVAFDIMGTKPKMIGSQALAVEAFRIMEKNSITQLMVVDEGDFKGIIHLHDILREGVF